MVRPQLTEEEKRLFEAFLMPKASDPNLTRSSFDISESTAPTAARGGFAPIGMESVMGSNDFAPYGSDQMRDLAAEVPESPPPVVQEPMRQMASIPTTSVSSSDTVAPPVKKVPNDSDIIKSFMAAAENPPKEEDFNPMGLIGQAVSGFGDAMVARGGGKGNALERTIGIQDKMAAADKEKAAIREMNDPNSAKSKAYQTLMKEMFPDMDIGKLSAAQAEKVMGPLGQVVDKREARRAAQEAKREKVTESEKPPKDYRWKSDGSGSVEPIPGGPEDKSINDQANRGQVISQAKNMLSTADQAIKQMGTGALTAGESGRIASWIPGIRQSRIDLENTISTLKANQAFQTLQKMREASKTGGALGQVSERELSLLENALASLDVNQSDKLLAENLVKVKTHWKNALDAVQQIQDRGDTKGPKAGTVEDGYRFKGGNASDPNNWEPV